MSFSKGSTEVKISSAQLVVDDSFAEEFVCKICMVNVVSSGPKLTKCSHLFCGDCLQHWIQAHPGNQTWAQRAKTGGAVPCPVCKTMLHKERDIFPVAEDGDSNSAMLWQMIQTLKVRCDGRHSSRADGCCGWIGDYGKYLDHLKSGTCGEEFKVPDVLSEAPAANISEEQSDTCEHQKHLTNICEDLMTSLEAESTGSHCSSESSLEELCSDEANNDSFAENKSQHVLVECTDAAPAVESVGGDLTSLIQAYVDLQAEQSLTSRPVQAQLQLDTSVLDALQPSMSTEDPPSSAREDESLERPSKSVNFSAAEVFLIPSANSEKQAATDSKDEQQITNACVKKERRPKKTRKPETERAQTNVPSGDMALSRQAWAQAAQQWQACQWQAYQQMHRYQQYQQYQMACAYQYQMALRSQSAQVQQAVARQQCRPPFGAK